MNNTEHCAMITRMLFHWKKLMHVMLLFDANGIPLGQWMQLGFKSWKIISIFNIFMSKNWEIS